MERFTVRLSEAGRSVRVHLEQHSVLLQAETFRREDSWRFISDAVKRVSYLSDRPAFQFATRPPHRFPFHRATLVGLSERDDIVGHIVHPDQPWSSAPAPAEAVQALVGAGSVAAPPTP